MSTIVKWEVITGEKVDKRFKYVYYWPMVDKLILLHVNNAKKMYLADMYVGKLIYVGAI